MTDGARKTVWLALLLVPLFGVAAARAQEEYVGSETCAACHDEVASAFGRTAHARAAGWDADKGCESCHGPGAVHADGEVDAIVRPNELPPRDASATCLACHEREERQFTGARSVHSLADVSCTDCHGVHSTADKLLPNRGVALCGDCHQGNVAQFDLPRAHPLPQSGAACESCHEPHTANTLRVSRGFGNTTCKTCHFEKAGPFVYDHDVKLTDDCSSCHEIHGSPNRHLMKHSRQINQCYQCHAADTTPAWHSASRFLNEKCTACHTAIHGSNTSPFFLEE